MYIFKRVAGLLTLALLVSVMLTTPSPTSAAGTIVVDDDGKATAANCNARDAADSSTIQGGIDAASVGDTVLVCPGTYVEDVEVDKAVILQGITMGKKRALVDGNGDDNGPVINIIVDGVTLDNFIIINAGTTTPTPGIAVESDNNIITHNIVSGNRCGINLWEGGGAGEDGANGNLVAHNTFFNNTSDGIRLQDKSGAGATNGANTIYHNTTHHNASDGIELRSGAANNVIKGNNAHNNASDGIFLKSGAASTNTVEFNHAHNNGDDGIDDDAGNGVSEAANHLHHIGDKDCEDCLP